LAFLAQGKILKLFLALNFLINLNRAKGFWLLSSSVIAIIKGIYIFLSIISNYKYIKVFKILIHLGVGAYLAILPKGLYYYNLLLLERPFYFEATAFYKVSVEFPFKLL